MRNEGQAKFIGLRQIKKVRFIQQIEESIIGFHFFLQSLLKRG